MSLNGVKKSKKEPYLVFHVPLTLPTKNTYCKFDFEELVRENTVEAGPDGEIIDNEVLESVRRLEEKYGNKMKKKKKKQNRGLFNVEDFVDKTDGYDIDDDFIDDSEAFEENVHCTMDTAKGGFYVNRGKLEFKTFEDLEEEEVTGKEKDEEENDAASDLEEVADGKATGKGRKRLAGQPPTMKAKKIALSKTNNDQPASPVEIIEIEEIPSTSKQPVVAAVVPPPANPTPIKALSTVEKPKVATPAVVQSKSTNSDPTKIQTLQPTSPKKVGSATFQQALVALGPLADEHAKSGKKKLPNSVVDKILEINTLATKELSFSERNRMLNILADKFNLQLTSLKQRMKVRRAELASTTSGDDIEEIVVSSTPVATSSSSSSSNLTPKPPASVPSNTATPKPAEVVKNFIQPGQVPHWKPSECAAVNAILRENKNINDVVIKNMLLVVNGNKMSADVFVAQMKAIKNDTQTTTPAKTPTVATPTSKLNPMGVAKPGAPRRQRISMELAVQRSHLMVERIKSTVKTIRDIPEEDRTKLLSSLDDAKAAMKLSIAASEKTYDRLRIEAMTKRTLPPTRRFETTQETIKVVNVFLAHLFKICKLYNAKYFESFEQMINPLFEDVFKTFPGSKKGQYLVNLLRHLPKYSFVLKTAKEYAHLLKTENITLSNSYVVFVELDPSASVDTPEYQALTGTSTLKVSQAPLRVSPSSAAAPKTSKPTPPSSSNDDDIQIIDANVPSSSKSPTKATAANQMASVLNVTENDQLMYLAAMMQQQDPSGQMLKAFTQQQQLLISKKMMEEKEQKRKVEEERKKKAEEAAALQKQRKMEEKAKQLEEKQRMMEERRRKAEEERKIKEMEKAKQKEEEKLRKRLEKERKDREEKEKAEKLRKEKEEQARLQKEMMERKAAEERQRQEMELLKQMNEEEEQAQRMLEEECLLDDPDAQEELRAQERQKADERAAAVFAERMKNVEEMRKKEEAVKRETQKNIVKAELMQVEEDLKPNVNHLRSTWNNQNGSMSASSTSSFGLTSPRQQQIPSYRMTSPRGSVAQTQDNMPYMQPQQNVFMSPPQVSYNMQQQQQNQLIQHNQQQLQMRQQAQTQQFFNGQQTSQPLSHHPQQQQMMMMQQQQHQQQQNMMAFNQQQQQQIQYQQRMAMAYQQQQSRNGYGGQYPDNFM